MLCWVVPFGERSGSSIRKKDQISPLGDRQLKALLTNGARSVINYDKEMRAYYLRKLAENKPEFVIINNIRFKILLRACAVVKRGTPFVERDTFRA